MATNGRNYIEASTMIMSDAHLRQLVRNVLISEELTRSDKNQIEKIAKAQAKKYFDKQIGRAIDDELSTSYFGPRGKVNKFVDDAITKRFKNSTSDKDFDASVIKIAKRVLKGLYDMHYKRNNLIDQMPVPKN